MLPAPPLGCYRAETSERAASFRGSFIVLDQRQSIGSCSTLQLVSQRNVSQGSELGRYLGRYSSGCLSLLLPEPVIRAKTGAETGLRPILTLPSPPLRVSSAVWPDPSPSSHCPRAWAQDPCLFVLLLFCNRFLEIVATLSSEESESVLHRRRVHLGFWILVRVYIGPVNRKNIFVSLYKAGDGTRPFMELDRPPEFPKGNLREP